MESKLPQSNAKPLIWQYKNYVIAFIIGVITKLGLPLSYGLTELGSSIMALILPIIFLWITESLGWPSLLVLIGFIVLGYDVGTVTSLSWGNSTVITLLITIIFTDSMRKNGVTGAIAAWFYTRKFVKGRPFVFLTMFMLADFILSLVLSIESCIILFSAIATSFLKDMGYEKKDKFYKCVMLGILWLGAVCDAASPMSHPIPLVCLGVIESTTGVTISYLEWLKLGLPFGIIMFIIQMLMIRFVVRPDTTKFMNFDIDKLKDLTPPLDRRGKVTVVIFVMVVLAWLIPDIIRPVLPALSDFLTQLGAFGPPAIGVCLLCLINFERRPIIEFDKVCADVPWFLIFFFAAISLFSGQLSTEETGISSFFAGVFEPVTEYMSLFVVIVFLCLMTSIITNFLSNIVTWTIFFVMGVPILTDAAAAGEPVMGIVPFGIMLCCMANLAVMAAPSSTLAALVYGPGYLKAGEVAKYNLIYLGVGFVATFIVLYCLGNALF